MLIGNEALDVQLAAAAAPNKIGATDKRMVPALTKLVDRSDHELIASPALHPRPDRYPMLDLLGKMKGDAAEAAPRSGSRSSAISGRSFTPRRPRR